MHFVQGGLPLPTPTPSTTGCISSTPGKYSSYYASPPPLPLKEALTRDDFKDLISLNLVIFGEIKSFFLMRT